MVSGGFFILAPDSLLLAPQAKIPMNVISTVTIRQQLEQNRTLVDAELDRILPPADEYPPSIHKAMRYSVFAGGKRLRPTLCLEAGRLFAAMKKSCFEWEARWN